MCFKKWNQAAADAAADRTTSNRNPTAGQVAEGQLARHIDLLGNHTSSTCRTLDITISSTQTFPQAIASM